MGMADELQKLQQLRDEGALDDDEFAAAKSRILNGRSSMNSGSTSLTIEEVESRTRTWATLLHLSQFAGYVLLPGAGLVLPIVIWQIMKQELPGLDDHGRNVANWIISFIIYLAISIGLSIVLIGIPLILALVVCALIFPILGALKANEGEVWKYPLTIEFF